MSIKKELISIVEKIIKIKIINTKYIGLGKHDKWDSLAHLNLLLEVEKNFGFKFTMKEMTKINTFNEILVKIKTFKNK